MFIKTKTGRWLAATSICIVIVIAITLLLYNFGYISKKPPLYLLAYALTAWIIVTLSIIQKESECSKHIRSVKQLRDSFEILFGIIKDIDIPKEKHEALADEIINVVQEMEYDWLTENFARFIIKTQMVHLIMNATLRTLDKERIKKLEVFNDEVTCIFDTEGYTTNEEE